MSKSAIYTANTNAQTIAVGSTIPLGSIIRRFGCSCNLNGDSINLTDTGYYAIIVSVTAAPTAAGTVTATLFNNGVEVSGANASATTTAAAQSVTLAFPAIVRIPCCGADSTLSVVLSGAESSVTNLAVTVEKL